jgi:enolase
MPHPSEIHRIHAREVFDSRGKPTVEVEVICQSGAMGSAIVPSGASTGQFEALELRDKDRARLDGQGVLTAVDNVIRKIAPALSGIDAMDQERVDARLLELDGTPDKSRLGANAILGVSLAAAHTAAAVRGVPVVMHLHDVWLRARERLQKENRGNSTGRQKLPEALGRDLVLPLPMVNMISGGLHAGRNLDFQDFLILPVGATSYREALVWVVTVYRRLGKLLVDAGLEGVLVGDEGGYGPRLATNEQALTFVVKAIEAAGLAPGRDVAIGLDVASTHFFDGEKYTLQAGGARTLTSGEMVDLLAEWVDRYPIISIEDGLADEDWEGWKLLTSRLGSRVQLIGDDLFVTNDSRLQRGIAAGVGNSVLIKVNQIGTLSETLATMCRALAAGYWPVVSARSGETEDATIADLAVASGAGQIKIGSIARSERLAKYNQLLRLEERLGPQGIYLGGAIFRSLQ